MKKTEDVTIVRNIKTGDVDKLLISDEEKKWMNMFLECGANVLHVEDVEMSLTEQ